MISWALFLNCCPPATCQPSSNSQGSAAPTFLQEILQPLPLPKPSRRRLERDIAPRSRPVQRAQGSRFCRAWLGFACWLGAASPAHLRVFLPCSRKPLAKGLLSILSFVIWKQKESVSWGLLSCSLVQDLHHGVHHRSQPEGLGHALATAPGPLSSSPCQSGSHAHRDLTWPGPPGTWVGFI